MPELKSFTREEVKRHVNEDDLWIIIDTVVYDMSRFVDMYVFYLFIPFIRL